jgi:hypothetical protein
VAEAEGEGANRRGNARSTFRRLVEKSSRREAPGKKLPREEIQRTATVPPRRASKQANRCPWRPWLSWNQPGERGARYMIGLPSGACSRPSDIEARRTASVGKSAGLGRTKGSAQTQVRGAGTRRLVEIRSPRCSIRYRKEAAVDSPIDSL